MNKWGLFPRIVWKDDGPGPEKEPIPSDPGPKPK
jgi:hypothetical protein